MKLLLVVLFVGAVSAVVKEQQACFDSTSYIRYNAGSNTVSQSEDNINFKFRSRDASGLLLYAHSTGLNGDYILLELIRGKLSVQYQLGGNSTLKEAILGNGLGDDILSTVVVKRKKKNIEVSAYGGQSDKTTFSIPGDDDRVDLNGFIYVGGYPNPPDAFPSVQRVNFRGCMLKATYDKIDFIDGAKNNRAGFTKRNVKFTNHPEVAQRSMNFERDTFLQIRFQRRDPNDPSTIVQKFNGSLEFRTVLHKGTVFQASSVSLKFSQSQLSLHSGSDIVSIDFPKEGQANDGRWFHVEFVAENGYMMLKLNGKMVEGKPANNPQFGSLVTFGAFENDRRFIGCIRNLIVLNTHITYPLIINPYLGQYKVAEDWDKLTEGCKASDPCVPNPCFHEAECLVVVRGRGVECNCRQSYKEPFCQFSKLATSCSAKKKYQPGTITGQRVKYPIDPDDSGPLPPVKVQCDYNKNPEGLTEIETQGATQVAIDPAPYGERFSYKKNIKYDIPIASVRAIVVRSKHCSQVVKYDCRDAKLFNAPGGDPSSRWLSANGYLQYYWGGAEPNSYKCACAYRPKGCLDKAFCNCDSKQAETIPNLDQGVLNVTGDLPVRQVQFGLLSKTSQAIYTIKRVACYGVDTLGTVTFLAPDGWVRAPAWNSPLGGDLSFYIKTVFSKGDLIDHRNKDESHIFQVRIRDESTIEVSFSFGTGIRTKYRAALDGKLNDNEWHRIQVIRTLWYLEVKIDDMPGLDPVNKQKLNPYELTGDGRSRLNIDQPMFIGSFWRFPTYKSGYVGCMKGFTINGKLFSLAKAVDHLAMEPEVLVVKGCGNACEHKPCPFGTCVDKYTSFECDCTDTPFYGTYCSKEIGTKIQNSPVYATLNMTSSAHEKFVLAFSTEADQSGCKGTLFQVLNEDETQYYKLVLKSRTSLELEFKLVPRLPEERMKIDVDHMDFCDTTRHIVNIERIHYRDSSFIRYRIDGRKLFTKEYRQEAERAFDKPYNYYVGNTKKEDDPFVGCISGAKFHLFDDAGVMKTIEPIADGVRSNDTSSQIKREACGPTINTPVPMTNRAIPGPTTPTDYPSTEFLRDVGIHEAEDTNWAVLIVVSLLLMLVLVAVVVLTIWYVMQHKNDYQILEKADGTVVGTATVRGGASVASFPAGGHGSAYFAPVRAPPSQSSLGNLSRTKSKSNDLFV